MLKNDIKNVDWLQIVVIHSAVTVKLVHNYCMLYFINSQNAIDVVATEYWTMILGMYRVFARGAMLAMLPWFKMENHDDKIQQTDFFISLIMMALNCFRKITVNGF